MTSQPFEGFLGGSYNTNHVFPKKVCKKEL